MGPWVLVCLSIACAHNLTLPVEFLSINQYENLELKLSVLLKQLEQVHVNISPEDEVIKWAQRALLDFQRYTPRHSTQYPSL